MRRSGGQGLFAGVVRFPSPDGEEVSATTLKANITPTVILMFPSPDGEEVSATLIWKGKKHLLHFGFRPLTGKR